jgi:hypothetical protein
MEALKPHTLSALSYRQSLVVFLTHNGNKPSGSTNQCNSTTSIRNSQASYAAVPTLAPSGNSSLTPTSTSTLLPPGDGPVSRADYNKMVADYNKRMVAAKDKYKHSYTTLLALGDDQSVTLSERSNIKTVEIAAGVPSLENDTLPDRSFLQ